MIESARIDNRGAVLLQHQITQFAVLGLRMIYRGLKRLIVRKPTAPEPTVQPGD